MQIRELVIEDFDDERFVSSFQELGFVRKAFDAERLRRIFVARRPLTETIVAVDEGKAVGIVSGMIYLSFSGRDRATMYELFIAESHRGQGIGRSICLFLEKLMKERHQARYIIGPAEDEIVGFYESLGGAKIAGTHWMSKRLFPNRK